MRLKYGASTDVGMVRQSNEDAFSADDVRFSFDALYDEKAGNILAEAVKVGGKPLVYFDNAASSQMPQPVIDRLVRYQKEQHANIHRGVHYLSETATAEFEAARHAGIGIREMHMAYERHLATVAAQRPAAQLGGPETPAEPVVKGGGLTTPEEDLILFLLRHDSYFVPLAQSLPLEWIDLSGRGGQLLMALLNEAVHGHFSGVREALNALDDGLPSDGLAHRAPPVPARRWPWRGAC